MNIPKSQLRANEHSQTLAINQLSLERAASGEKVFAFGFGQSPFPVPEEICAALADSARRKEYMSVQGHAPLRNAIAAFHGQLENKRWQADQIVVGAGSKILIFCVMAALKRAEVLLPAPSWVSYDPQARLAGHKVTWLTTRFEDRWLLTPEQLDGYCRARTDETLPLLLILNSPSNPTGQTYSSAQLKALAPVLRRHNVIVIADEIYSLLNYDNDYAALDEFYPEACIVTSGLSKWCGAGGWRLGFAHVSESLGNDFLQAVIAVASETYSCAAAPVQVAATRAYSNQELARNFLDRQTTLLGAVARHCSDALTSAGAAVHAASGGFYLFPVFESFRERLAARGIRSSEQLATALMAETGVALLPGSAFGMPEDSLTARLAFVDFDGAQVLDTGGREPSFDKVREGMDVLSDWLDGV